MSGYSLKN